VKAALEKAGKPFHLAFCPERTIEGRALSELRTLPQIVGGLDDDSTLRGAALFSFLTPTIIKVSSLETAEMIKLVNNTQRDLLFAFANEIADYCDICEISADEVIKAANAGYARSVMPLPGPVGGPCLEKDPYILAESITQRGGSATLALAARQFNENLPMRTAQLLATLAEQRGVKADAVKKVSVLGLAFKGRPETSDLRGSLAIPLVQELKKQFPKAQLCGYDPLVPKAETEKLGAVPCASVEDAFKDAHIVLFHTNHPLFEKLDLPELAESCARPAIIYDYWTQFTAEEMFLPERVAYMSLGSKVFGKKR
jgi:nucleotide sugar dehydrogenase